MDELNRWTEHLGWLIVSAAHAFAPELVILSGGATQICRLFSAGRDPARESVSLSLSKGNRCRL